MPAAWRHAGPAERSAAVAAQPGSAAAADSPVVGAAQLGAAAVADSGSAGAEAELPVAPAAWAAAWLL